MCSEGGKYWFQNNQKKGTTKKIFFQLFEQFFFVFYIYLFIHNHFSFHVPLLNKF